MQRSSAATWKSFALIAAGLLGCTALASPAFAQEATPADQPEGEEIIITGSLNALPLEGVGSIFGFDKTLVETPRSASTVSQEQMERFGITQIYDLVSQAPGAFTSSFFGTGGALDIRGAPSDVYFRGMLRLDNPGNYSTPIGAADRIDIVRGPASVIYGPSKIGGYMNFVPKTARATNGAYAAEAKGYVSYDIGSWGRNVGKGSLTGPGKIGGHEFGYSLYAEIEDSHSYYNYVVTKNVLLSAAFDTNITSSLRAEFGGMFQRYNGVQNSGWNRLTQNLVDNGTYITGQPTPLDTNADGKVSRGEAAAANGGNGIAWFGSFPCGVFVPFKDGLDTACFLANPDMNLVNPGTTQLSRRQTLTGPDDKLKNTQKTAYFDLIWEGAGDLQIKNQLFYDGGQNLNENAYGFSQQFKSYVIETRSSCPTASRRPSRKSRCRRRRRFATRIFTSRMTSAPSSGTARTSARAIRRSPLAILSTQCDCNYSDYVNGHYTDLGMAGLVDVDFNFGLDFIGGLRYDHVPR